MGVDPSRRARRAGRDRGSGSSRHGPITSGIIGRERGRSVESAARVGFQGTGTTYRSLSGPREGDRRSMATSMHVFAHHAHVFPANVNPNGTIDRLMLLLDACAIDEAVCFAPFPHQVRGMGLDPV